MLDSFPWYSEVPPDDRLYQGEIVFECRVVRWKAASAKDADLQDLALYVTMDVVVMTQDCDLGNGKIPFVILCPAFPVASWKTQWEQTLRSKNQNPSDKAWAAQLNRIAQGNEVALALLDDLPATHPGGKRIIDFKEVYTIPRAFLESLVKNRPRRLMLRPPYREHLSQSFARFFMRVGLPTPISIP